MSVVCDNSRDDDATEDFIIKAIREFRFLKAIQSLWSNNGLQFVLRDNLWECWTSRTGPIPD